MTSPTDIADMSAPSATACPKRMVYGPCGGAHPDGGCEVVAGPCVFPEPTPVPVSQQRTGTPLAATPLVLTDFSTPPFDVSALRRTAEILAPSCDAVLVGEHQDRPDFPPTLFATLLRDAGLRPWITLACRDRNRVGLEQEIAGLRQVGVDAVLCVTGDARAYDVRPDVTQVFDLDGPRLTMLAAAHGLPAAVPETITAAPVALRPARLVDKQRCGASVAVLNHVAHPRDVARFVAAARTAGLRIPVIAAVAVYTDEMSAAALSGLPGLALDQATVHRVVTARDPRVAGIEAAVAEARALLAVDGVDGVNLSGLASAAGWEHAAGIKAEIGRLVRAEQGR